MKIKGDKGSILLMSAVLLSVIILIGTMIITVFFKGYIDIAHDIRIEQERLSIQVEAQEIAATLELTDPADIPSWLMAKDEDGVISYSFNHENDKYIVSIVLNEELKIIKWNLKEK